MYPQLPTGLLADAVPVGEVPGSSHNDPGSLSLGDLNSDGLTDVALGTSRGLFVIRQSVDSVPVAPGYPCDTTSPAVTIEDTSEQMSQEGNFTVDVRCPADEASGVCRGGVTLRTASAVVFQGEDEPWTFQQSDAFEIAAGQTETVSVAGDWDDRALMVQYRDLEVVAATSGADRHGNSFADEKTYSVVAPSETEPVLCRGLVANYIGSSDDDYSWSYGVDDVAVLGLGQDVFRAETGNDVACGGAGNDYLVGGPGDDTLSGQRDQDTLSGGRGFDKCIGGHPRGDLEESGDHARRNCESTSGALPGWGPRSTLTR